MTSQQTLTLNPSYSGPMIIAETLRKMKSNNGLNRMLSSYNKRFFVLDLNYCTFYYLPDKQAHFTSSTDIPLSSIISIKVTKQSEGLEEDRIWKHEFVITTKKKSFELITDCKNLMEKMLYAFGNIINTKTNKPLFNWNQYIGAQDNNSSPSNLPLPKSSEASPQKQSEASFMTPEESPVDVKAFQPEQRGEALSAELTKIERASREEEAQQSPGKESCSSDDQKENKDSQEEAQKKTATLQFRRKGNSFAASRGKGFAVEEGQEKAGQQEATSPVKKEVDSVQEQEKEEPKQSLSPVKEKLQIKIQMLNFDKIEESEIKGQDQQRPICSSRDMSKKYNLGEQAVRRSASRLAVNNKSASMKNMTGPENEFVGFNQIDLTSKNRSSKGNEGQGSARILNVQKQSSFGTGVGQEASRFSLFKKSEKPAEVKRSEKNDDDWDNEMFGDGKNQLSPLKPKNHEDKQRQAYEYKNMSSEKKIQSQLSQKRSEFVASRQGTHNDWDDEL